MAYDADFFVIGAGSGGVRAARIAAMNGARTIVAEESRIGGTCVIRGCVPKKLYVYASRFKDDFEDAAGFGWTIGETSFDWPKLVAAKEQEITRLSAAYRRNLAASRAELIEERATIVGPHAVQLAGGRKITAEHILVAVGSRPVVPHGIEGREYTITSNEIFDLAVFPRRLMVVGGGYIAVEFAALFQRLGAEVTLILRGPNVLRGFDDDMRAGVRDALARAGVTIRFGVVPKRFERKPDGSLVATLTDGAMVEIDQALMATGRMPYTKGLGIENAGVKCSEHGAVKTDDCYTTSVPSIHAIGDVTHRVNLTPVAIREGHALADRLFGQGKRTMRYDAIAHVVFCTPELGAVGLTEAEALAKHADIDIYKADFRPMKATLSGSAERVIMKIVVDAGTQRVLGVHILAHDSGEMIQLTALALTMGATKADLDATVAVHPTAAEELVTMLAPTAKYRGSERVG